MHAEGLRPRGLGDRLTFTPATVLPSIIEDNVGSPDFTSFAAQWLACIFPCQRFKGTLASASA
jgi:hypothetical protein